MHILFFTKGDKATGSSRQRVWRLAEHLHGLFGYEYEILYPKHKDFADTKKIKEALKKSDVLFVHKSLFAWKIIFLVLRAKYIGGKKLVYDLDDAEWEHTWAKTILLVRSADMVTCGSRVILSWCLRHNRRSTLVPTGIDHDTYAVHTVSYDTPISTIGWIGTGKGHFQDGHFHTLKKVFDHLYESRQFRFVIIGAMNYQPLKDFFKSALYDVEYIDELNWAHPGAVAELIQKYQFTVGVMPVSDTNFNRAKCAFKAIEYMGCGVPVVASRVGEAVAVVEKTGAGLCVTSEDEWVSALETLIEDAQVREKMGYAGKEAVKESYSYAAIAPRVDALLKAFCD